VLDPSIDTALMPSVNKEAHAIRVAKRKYADMIFSSTQR
jgi:hypothetical protein